MKKQTIYTIMFFFITTGFLAFPFFLWGFVNDDFVFLHYCIKTPWSNILSFFYHGSPSNNGVYANASMPNLSFLVALYRPLLSLFIKIQTNLFNLNAYAYKIFGVVIHTSLATILFNFLLSYFSIGCALAGALYFAFHPSLFSWLGVLACQTYAYDLVFLLFTTTCLVIFFKTNNSFFYILSCLLAFCSMLARESLLFLPLWITFFTLFYGYILHKQKRTIASIYSSLKIALGFCIAYAAYIGLKLYLFPFKAIDSGTGFNFTLSSFIHRQSERFYDLVTLLCDFFGVSLIPGNHQIIKGCLLIAGVTLLIIPFFIKRQKMLLAFLLLSLAVFNWTSLLITHHARYIYASLPFFIIMLCFALQFYATKFESIKKLFFIPVYGCLLLLIVATINNQKITARSINILSSSIEKLSNNPKLENQTIYLVGLPMPWSGIGIEQGLKLYNPNLKNSVIPLTQTYKQNIKFLSETHHTNVAIDVHFLHGVTDSNQGKLFVSWDFKKHDFYIINNTQPQP